MSVKKMRPSERREKLLEVLCIRRHDTIKNLAEEFHVSPRTIKYDIEELTLTYPIDTIRGRYANSYFLNANSVTQPGIVDADRQPILDQNEVYSGCYGRASLTFYAFNRSGNRGIACGLNNLQKIRDGEPLDGHTRAKDDFADDDDNDFLN